MPNPIIPRASTVNKTGTGRIEASANAETRRRLARFYSSLKQWLMSVPVSEARYNAAEDGRFYFYQLDDRLMNEIDFTLERLRMDILMATDDRTREHYMAQAATLGYQQGTEAAIENFDQLTNGEYARSVAVVLASDPYRDRIAYISSRAFEDFNGFTQQMTTELRRLLTDGMANGDSPLVIARKVAGRVGVSRSRALRIARTEITNAHRRAIWDEDGRATATGLRTGLLHVSALIPGRTRHTHAQKHGSVWRSREALAEWYAKDGNSVNCLCSQSSVLLNKDGSVATGAALVKKMREDSKKYVATAG